MEPVEDEASHQHPKMSKTRKHTENPSTSTKVSIPTLPEELITQILVRLPVKSLLQFKCVSKDWFALISTPQFVNTHLRFSAKDRTRHRFLLKIEKHYQHSFRHYSVSSLFYESVTEAFDLDYPVRYPKSIVGSVNGLICYRIGSNGFVLWNPSTRKFKKVSDLITTQTYHFHFNCGFGYDVVHDDYKIVAIFREIIKEYDDVKIYSLKSDSWRTLDYFQGEKVYHSSSKLVNGKLHWVSIVDGSRGIMSIDLVDEKFRKVEQPCYGEEHSSLKLGVLGSDLSVLCCCHKRTDVWVMKEYGVKESWTKLYTIKCPKRVRSPPLCMSIEGEILHVIESTLMIYNLDDGLTRYPEVTNFDGYREVELYIESLVCPVLQNEAMSQH